MIDEAICEFVKCGSCSTVFDVRSSDACPKCGTEPPDPDDDFEPDPDVDDAIAEGFGDECPFHGDVYADHRAMSFQLVDTKKWEDRWSFMASEVEKSKLHSRMAAAVRKLRGKQLARALDTWERCIHAWKDFDADDMKRELEPWLDSAEVPRDEPESLMVALPYTGRVRRFLRRMFGG